MSAFPPPVEPPPAPPAMGQATPATAASSAAYPAVPYPVPPVRHAGVRYGIGVTAATLGGYLMLSGDTLNQLTYAVLPGRNDPAAVLLALTSLILWTVVTAAAMVVVPGSPATGWGAAVLVGTGVVLYSAIQAFRFTGALRLPGDTSWIVLLHPATFTLLVVGAAWLIARRRSPLAFLLLLLAFVPGAVALGLMLANVGSAVVSLVVTPLAVVIGVGTAWLAALMSRRRDPLGISALG